MGARGLNQAQIIGNLGQDPEIRYTADGKAIANISVATSEEWKDQQGNKQSRVEWHRIVIFGKLAEIVGQYLTKGSKVFIQGKLQTRKWQDQQGQDKYTTEIVVDGFTGQLQMLGDGGGQGQQQAPQQQQQPQQQGGYQQAPQQRPQQPARQAQQAAQPQGGYPQAPGGQGNEGFDDFSDDIPF